MREPGEGAARGFSSPFRYKVARDSLLRWCRVEWVAFTLREFVV